MCPSHLYIIRHGDSHKQHNGIIGGPRGDSGLTPLGVRQAERLRDRLAASGELRADVLIASPLPRAWQTAEIVAPTLGLPIIADAEVEEIRKGAADGLPRGEAHARFGVPDFAHHPYRPIAPGGEDWAGFALRAATALDRIAREYAGQAVVVVSHGGIIHVALMRTLGLPTAAPLPAWFATENASISSWLCDADALSGGWRLERYNDALHLLGIEGGRRMEWGSPLALEAGHARSRER